MAEVVSEKVWHVIYTKSKWEKKVDSLLLQRGFESWCPVQKKERQWSDRKKIIEFNGDIFHGNPSIFSKDDKPNPFDKKITCEDMWRNDKRKIDFIKEEGFEVLTIWENDYRLNKNEIIEKCKKFLYGG